MIDLHDVSKVYQIGEERVHALDHVTLHIFPKEFVSVIGPSGSGKSTLMNIIGCLDVPTSGTYILDGENISGKTDAELSALRNRTIGFVFQNFNLLPRESALDNVALPMLYAGVHRRERMERARKALERVGLGDRLHFKPTQLSGGQKQRVAIARAMVMKPSLLLADEPTGALDTASGEQVMELFRQLNEEGVTIVMITHEQEIANYAHRQLMIRDGRLSDHMGGAPV